MSTQENPASDRSPDLRTPSPDPPVPGHEPVQVDQEQTETTDKPEKAVADDADENDEDNAVSKPDDTNDSNHQLNAGDADQSDIPSTEPRVNGDKDDGEQSPEKPSVPPKDGPKEVQSDSASSSAAYLSSTAPSTPPDTSRHNRRAPSIALSVSSTASGVQTVSSMVFIKKALESIAASKDARKILALDSAVKKALTQIKENPGSLPSPAVVFEPLRIVCAQSSNGELKVIALDCIGKLFSFSYLEDPVVEVDPDSGVTPPPPVPLIDRAISTVCDNFTGESTDPKVEMQIIKALMAAVLNEDLVCHGSTLLKALRQTYTVFVVSHSNTNQATAQAALTQMVNVVFERVKRLEAVKSSMSRASSTINVSDPDGTSSTAVETTTSSGQSTPTKNLTLKDIKGRPSLEDVRDDADDSTDDDTDLFIKDAFLVFRTMCKLSEKALDGDPDLKSHAMRSKLLSLHLLHTILKSHMNVFMSRDIVVKSNAKGNEPFVVAIKDYLCSTLARNAASISPPVFEISAEVFWLILSNLRSQFKKEIEVFFAEIYFPILEMKTSTSHQKQYLLGIIQKLCNDPRALVELYLNYDCDRRAMINVYEHTIDVLVRLAVTPVHMTPTQLHQYQESRHKPIAVYNLALPPALSITNLSINSHTPESTAFPPEYALKMMALESLAAILRSLLTWSQRGIATSLSAQTGGAPITLASVAGDSDTSIDDNLSASNGHQNGSRPRSTTVSSTAPSATASSTLVDDPSQFESLKQQKTALSEAIADFNYKPKRGLEYLIRDGFIESREPAAIAKFLLTTEGLDKAVIGEYLGGDDPFNISVMHAFVEQIDFNNMDFVGALRKFLQAFRLPGEAQKIDRFMLKFAERYLSGNPGVFANADTPYILAYSVIMLNTDQHSAQVKNRMSPEEFIKNNRGINDKADLPDEFLLNIFNDIANNEIKLLSEQHAALLSSDGKQAPAGFAATFGLALATRNTQREAYLQASKEMSSKTERVFKSLIAKDGKKQLKTSEGQEVDGQNLFYIASHVEHVKPMFEVAWMSFLAGLSGPFQESDDHEPVSLALEGMRLSIRIACLFDLELPRISFVTTLGKYTNLMNWGQMKVKSIDAVKTLLSVALSEGNMLKSSWKDVLQCVSQLERLQLISSGIEAGAIPDLGNAKIRTSIDSTRSRHNAHNPATHNLLVVPEVAEAVRSREVVVAMDKIFTQSAKLSGEAIVEFVKALSEVSWEEIESSGQNHEHPRTFALQKMVDVCYYNMDRIRVEWSQLWAIMGEQFNKVGCYGNGNVVSFALDSLRQLSMRFLDIEELPHFKFQKDFLRPFEFVMRNNPDAASKDLTLQCLQQMILTKSDKIRSGWSTMFNVFAAAASVPNAQIVSETYDLAKRIHTEYFDQVIEQDSFDDMLNCLAELAKNPRFQKAGLHAIELLNETIPKVVERTGPKDDNMALWFPILKAFQKVIMEGEDLEVRSRALNYLFDSLVEHGSSFGPAAWDRICEGLLFPIFRVLESRSRAQQEEDNLSVWLSTTMIQALRNMIALLSYYFDILERLLDGFLDLLVRCINQENETVSKIGSSCLHQLVAQNLTKFNRSHWSKVVDKIELLFQETTATELFQPPGKDGSSQVSHMRTVSVGITDQKNVDVDSESAPKHNLDGSKRFRKTVIKSVLQSLMISSVGDLLADDEVFKHMPTEEVLRICNLLRRSYLFSREFNGDRELRMRLWKQGFMKQMPNLLKQESTSALTYVTIMMRLYKDNSKSSGDREAIGQELISQGVEIIKSYNSLEATEQRYISTLWPVILEFLSEYKGFSDEDFKGTIAEFYPHFIGLLSRDLAPELRTELQEILQRTGKVMFE